MALNFHADLANKKGLSPRKGIRMYILQQYFKNRQVDCSFVECPVLLMLVVLPWLYIFLVICISYVISDLVISRSVLADLDPCSNASCKYHSHCVSLSPNQFTCACEGSCPSYEEQVCASNGRTFTNLCLLKQEICRTRGNYTKYHPGSCIGTFLFKSKTFKFLNRLSICFKAIYFRAFF